MQASVHETRHARGERISAHRHAFAYAALVLEGGYEEAGAEGAARVEAGDLIVHPPFHLHLNRFEIGAARVLNVTLSHSLMRRLGANAYGVYALPDPDRLARRARHDPIDALGAAMGEGAAKSLPPPRDWLDTFAAALRAAPTRRIDALCRELRVAPAHASRAFTRRFGMSPARFRAEQRLRAGLRLLAEGARPLAEIAAASFYADQPHLSRAIRAATGQTPARLRAAFC